VKCGREIMDSLQHAACEPNSPLYGRDATGLTAFPQPRLLRVRPVQLRSVGGAESRNQMKFRVHPLVVRVCERGESAAKSRPGVIQCAPFRRQRGARGAVSVLLRRHFGGPLQKASSASEVSTGTIVSPLFPVSRSWQLPQNAWHCIRAKCSCSLRTPLLTALRGNVAEVGGL